MCKTTALSEGSKVLLSIRPEDCVASTEAPPEGTPNVIKCSIDKAVYMGGVLELWLSAGGRQIRVHGHRLPILESGASVYVSIDPASISAIKGGPS